MILLSMIPVLLTVLLLIGPYSHKSQGIATGLGMLLSAVTSWYQYTCSEVSTIVIPVFSIYTYSVNITLLSNSVVFLQLSMLATVSCCILMYTLWYSHEDSTMTRLSLLLVFFTLSMQLVIVSYDIVTMFVSWELIGITSCMLIGYFGDREEAIRSSMKASLYNRIGDVCLLVSIAILLTVCGDTTLMTVSLLSSGMNPQLATVLSVGLVVSAWAKSAQLGLHLWLLDAMEGPTPVSSLLHSATLVTAGIVILTKTKCIWSVCPSVSLLITVLGILSAMTASLTAIVYWDSKRVIAYSTCTHISLMFASLGITGNIDASLEHLYVHGWSKSLLFMLTGLVIHTSHSQDTRVQLPLGRLLPLVGSLTVIAVMSLQGCPGSMLSESKDWMLSTTCLSLNVGTIVLILVGIVWCSQGYSLGIFMACWTEQNIQSPYNIRQPSLGLLLPLVVLGSNVAFLPMVSGDYLQSSHLGELDTAELMPTPFIEPLGSIVMLGILTGAIHSTTSTRKPRWIRSSNTSSTLYSASKLDVEGKIPTSMTVGFSSLWNRLYLDKLWNTTMLKSSVYVNLTLQSNVEQGILLTLLSPMALFRQPATRVTMEYLSSTQLLLPLTVLLTGIITIL